MAVYRVERTRDYTVMSNYHLKDTSLSLKAKGLLSMFLSFPDDWNYSTRGLAAICKEGVDAIGNTIKELEKAGYIVRRKLRGSNGRITDTEYVIYEQPQEPPAPDADEPDTTPPGTAQPDTGKPDMADPDMDAPHTENPVQLNKYQSVTQKSNTQRSNTHSFPPSAPSPQVPARPVEGMKEIFEKRADIQAQIDYELIVMPSNRAQVDEFVEIMLEVALTRTPTMKIGRDAEYPTAFVQQRFNQLTSIHKGIADTLDTDTRLPAVIKSKAVAAVIIAALMHQPPDGPVLLVCQAGNVLHRSTSRRFCRVCFCWRIAASAFRFTCCSLRKSSRMGLYCSYSALYSCSSLACSCSHA